MFLKVTSIAKLSTGVLFAAPISLLPLIYLKLSSVSRQSFQASLRAGILPLNLLIFSRSLDIKILMLFRILLMEILEIPIKFAIFSSFNIFCKILKNLSKFLFLKFANGLYTYFLTSLRLLFIITSTKSQFLCLYSLGEKLP